MYIVKMYNIQPILTLWELTVYLSNEKIQKKNELFEVFPFIAQGVVLIS